MLGAGAASVDDAAGAVFRGTRISETASGCPTEYVAKRGSQLSAPLHGITCPVRLPI